MTDETTQASHTLDHNREIGFDFQLDGQGGANIRLRYPLIDALRFTRQLQRGLSLRIGDHIVYPKGETIEVINDPRQLLWHIPADDLQEFYNDEKARLDVELFHERLLRLQQEDGTLAIDTTRLHERLTVDEIKQLANADGALPGVPYPRVAMEGFSRAHHAPITELHTHSTAQIKAEDLMDIALKHDREADDNSDGITYPVELLALLKQPLSEQQRKQVRVVPSIKFDPTRDDPQQPQCEKANATCDAIRLRDLTQHQRDAIVQKMKIRQDTIQPFSQFDPEMYRYRNPFAKRDELAYSMIMQIARDYANNGVQYAELSTGSMLDNPEWFRQMIRAVEDAEKETGVKIRFLASIPRSFEPAQMLKALDKVKYAARHPYIVGVDLLGYEFNSTKDFAWALEHIAQWASVYEGSDLKETGWDFRRDFTIRVHAGETGKRRENVLECAKVAKEYGVKVRIAHALNAKLTDDDRAFIKSQGDEGRLMFELCPPSNLTYNNISSVDKVPVKQWGELAPVTLSTDGGGAVQSQAEQLALSALAAGWTLEDLVAMRATEERYIENQMRNEAIKRQAYEAHYKGNADDKFLSGFKAELDRIKAHTIHKELGKHLPFLIVGSGGKTYNDLMPVDLPTNHAATAKRNSIENKANALLRLEMAIGFEMLRLATDPDANGFIFGRAKQEGVSELMNASLRDHRRENPEKPFKSVTVYSKGTTELASSLTYCEQIPQDPSAIPKNLFERATSLKPPALGIFAGGGTFTNDVLRYYRSEHAFENSEALREFLPKDDSESRVPYRHGLPFVLWSNIPGTTQDQAPYIDKSHLCANAIGFLEAIDRQVRGPLGSKIYGNILPFRPEFYVTTHDGKQVLDEVRLKSLRNQAEANVMARATRDEESALSLKMPEMPRLRRIVEKPPTGKALIEAMRKMAVEDYNGRG